MNKPTVSIIVPCYNQAKFLDEALGSINNQSYKNWECLIINDGSTDNTEKIAVKWKQKDLRYKYFYKNNGGLSSARNFGLLKAKGKYIQFLDSDDCIDDSKIELSIYELNKSTDIGIAITNFNLFKKQINNVILYGKISVSNLNFETILYKWDDFIVIPIHCGLFEAKLFDDFRFPENIKAKEDWVMWVYLFSKKIKIVHIDLPLAFYRKHQESMTMTMEILPEYIKAYKAVITMITKEQLDRLTVELISRYYMASMENKIKLNEIKNSNTYKFGLFFKRILQKIMILKMVTYFLQKRKSFKNNINEKC